MANAMRLSSSIIGQSICTKRASKHSFGTVMLTNISHKHQEADIKMIPKPTYMKRVIKTNSFKLFVVPPRDSITDSSSFSPAQTIMLFYSAINEKNLKQMGKLIAEDCLFEDYYFPKPFHGKKEVLHFLEQLTMSMGQNMQFNIEHLCEGSDYTVGVNWHLDWNKIQVPFTRGCSTYSLSINSDKLLIEKAQVLVEPPIKLGGAVLTIFKIVSALFDAFPSATEWFLKSPHIVFHLLLKTYKICLQPLVTPLLAWYIKLLNFAACILKFTLNVLYYLSKIFRT